jgi:hypothetical protein
MNDLVYTLLRCSETTTLFVLIPWSIVMYKTVFSTLFKSTLQLDSHFGRLAACVT